MKQRVTVRCQANAGNRHDCIHCLCRVPGALPVTVSRGTSCDSLHPNLCKLDKLGTVGADHCATELGASRLQFCWGEELRIVSEGWI